jgi:crotonobetainyl-CoA:carnitine CoA-transferase CaiB-like acyl-CoA transferase
VAETTSAQPLAGLTVVELGTSVAAPTAAMILAELGADVIKIENPRGGDDARAWGPPFVNGVGTNYVAIDLKDERQCAALRRFILERADIVVQNLRAGVVTKLGLDAATLTGAKPSLIYCNLHAFGAAGPRADKPGYDPLMQAFGGIMSITGHDGDSPVRVGPAIVDQGSAMWMIIGVLAALHHRTATGKGTVVDGSLYETALAWVGIPALQYLASEPRRAPRRLGSENIALAPYKAFQAQNGWVVVAAGNDGQFGRLAATLGHPEWAEDLRFRTNPDRVKNRTAINELVAAAIATAPRDHWQAMLDAAGVPCAPVLTIDEVLAHPQSRELGMLQEAPDGGAPVMGLPISFDGVRPPFRNSAPALGNATDIILGASTKAKP